MMSDEYLLRLAAIFYHLRRVTSGRRSNCHGSHICMSGPIVFNKTFPIIEWEPSLWRPFLRPCTVILNLCSVSGARSIFLKRFHSDESQFILDAHSTRNHTFKIASTLKNTFQPGLVTYN